MNSFLGGYGEIILQIVLYTKVKTWLKNFMQIQYLLLKVMGKVIKYSSKCNLGLRDGKKQTKRTLRYISEFTLRIVTLRVIFTCVLVYLGELELLTGHPAFHGLKFKIKQAFNNVADTTDS